MLPAARSLVKDPKLVESTVNMAFRAKPHSSADTQRRLSVSSPLASLWTAAEGTANLFAVPASQQTDDRDNEWAMMFIMGRD